MKELKKIAKALILIGTLLFVFNWIFFNIIYPAHLSYKNSCFPERTALENPELRVLGRVSYQIINNTKNITKEIFIEEEDEHFKKTNKHECIHINQAMQNRLYTSCRTPIKIINEIEAYTFSYLPDFIFNPIYGKNC